MFKTTKSKLIFVVIFSVICIIITSLMVLYKNIDTDEKIDELNNNNIIETNIKDVAGIDINGTYNQNDLKLEPKKYLSEKIEIEYYQIIGLKDRNIQEKINRELEQYGLNFYRETVKDLKEVEKVYCDMRCGANFANTLSISLSCYAPKIQSDDYYTDYMTLNYNLKNGEQITIDKLFTADAPIENILRKSAYYSFVSNNIEENLSWDFVVKDYDDIEDKILELILAYKKGQITNFHYTPNSIYIEYTENQNINIDMKQCAEYIAIYNRYLTEESLYESNNIGLKDIYTLSQRFDDTYYYTNYQKEKNYFIDINIMKDKVSEVEFENELVQQKIKDIETEIEKVKSLSNKNLDKFYILNYYIYIYTIEEWSTEQILTHCYEYGNAYEITVHDFEENVEPIIMEYNRREPMGEIPNYVYNFHDVLKEEPQETNEYYNPENGEKIVI